MQHCYLRIHIDSLICGAKCIACDDKSLQKRTQYVDYKSKQKVNIIPCEFVEGRITAVAFYSDVDDIHAYL